MKTLVLYCSLALLFSLPTTVFPQTYQGILDLSSPLATSEIKLEASDHNRFIRMARINNSEILIETNKSKFFLTIKNRSLQLKNSSGDSIGIIKRNKISFNGNTYRIAYPLGHDLRIKGLGTLISGRYSSDRFNHTKVKQLQISQTSSEEILNCIMLYKLAEKIVQDNDTSSYWLFGFVYALSSI